MNYLSHITHVKHVTNSSHMNNLKTNTFVYRRALELYSFGIIFHFSVPFSELIVLQNKKKLLQKCFLVSLSLFRILP